MESAALANRAGKYLESEHLAPPEWVEGLVGADGAPWCEAGDRLRFRTVVRDRFTLASVACRDAVELDEATFAQRTVDAYKLLSEQLQSGCASHLVRVWNFIPHILSPLGKLPQRYMVFNAGRFSAYEDWYRGRRSFDRCVATASGVGHTSSDLWIHGLACNTPGIPVENPRQIPAYRYSSRYGPMPPCFSRATRVIVDVLGAMVSAGTLGKHKAHIDKPVDIPMGEFSGRRWSNAP